MWRPEIHRRIKLKTKTKLIISDRRDRVWNDRCSHVSSKTDKECNKLTNEDTGQCPKGHGRSLHICGTRCCIILVAGNHKFCRYHRRKKLKSICKVTEKIQREWRSRMWGAKSKLYNMDDYQTKKDFQEWKLKQLEKTYDKEVLQQEKSLLVIVEKRNERID